MIRIFRRSFHNRINLVSGNRSPFSLQNAIECRNLSTIRRKRERSENSKHLFNPGKNRWNVKKETNPKPQLAPRPIFKVAVIGRPNVGKSTLFNRFAKRHKAIVSTIPGTTRDRKESELNLAGMDITLVDTGGLEDDADTKNASPLSAYILQKTAEAVSSAEIVLFVVDGREGLTEADRHYARWIRSIGKSDGVFVLVNKTEGELTDLMKDTLVECRRLGFGEPIPISAAHGDGMADIASSVSPKYAVFENRLRNLEEQGVIEIKKRDRNADNVPSKTVQLSIVGRPNVGKSSMLNAILDEDRAMTGPTPGLTRDAVAVEWEWNGRPVRLVDTAGIRRPGRRNAAEKAGEELEKLAVEAALGAIKLAQVVVLVVDGSEGILRRGEMSLASITHLEGRALVIAANKADISGVGAEEYREGVRTQVEALLPDLGGPPVVPLCSLTGYGVNELMNTVIDAHDRWRQRVPTALLNQWLHKMERIHPPPRETSGGKSTSSRAIRLKYLTQVSRAPPTFCLWLNSSNLLESYQRFILKGLQAEFGFYGMSVRLLLRKADNPYKKKKTAKTQAGAVNKNRRKDWKTAKPTWQSRKPSQN